MKELTECKRTCNTLILIIQHYSVKKGYNTLEPQKNPNKYHLYKTCNFTMRAIITQRVILLQ